MSMIPQDRKVADVRDGGLFFNAMLHQAAHSSRYSVVFAKSDSSRRLCVKQTIDQWAAVHKLNNVHEVYGRIQNGKSTVATFWEMGGLGAIKRTLDKHGSAPLDGIFVEEGLLTDEELATLLPLTNRNGGVFVFRANDLRGKS